MTAVADLLAQIPDPTHGTPLRPFERMQYLFDGEPAGSHHNGPLTGWRLAVEAVWPGANQAVWDADNWDAGQWGEGELQDLTPRLRGLAWSRGGYPRPEVGVCTISVDNTTPPFLSSIDPYRSWGSNTWAQDNRATNTYFRPGMPIRVIVFHPDLIDTYGPTVGLIHQFTGVVESWDQHDEHAGRESFIEITVVETLALLARVDELALPGVEGNDDTASERIERLADAADWPFGYHFHTPDNPADDSYFAEWDSFPLQSTDMALNRLGEIYQTGDSVGAVVRAGRDGRITAYRQASPEATTHRWPQVPPTPNFDFDGGGWWSYPAGPTLVVGELPPPGDPSRSAHEWKVGLPACSNQESVITSNGDKVINSVQMARRGGTAQEASDTASIVRHGKATTGRFDLINKSDELTEALAHAAIQTLEVWPGSLLMTQVTEPDSLFMIYADVHWRAVPSWSLHSRTSVAMGAYITTMTHTITFHTPGHPLWTATYELAPTAVPFVNHLPT
ncbi:MAG TPA: hypothetical protein VNQ73_16500 [Ilumatobacter sp.]|nr:hypothetical protein [Ilumatobacter sp.]